jgi:hypothetical protein
VATTGAAAPRPASRGRHPVSWRVRSLGAPVVAYVGAALVEVDLLLADLLADLLLLGHGVARPSH